MEGEQIFLLTIFLILISVINVSGFGYDTSPTNNFGYDNPETVETVSWNDIKNIPSGFADGIDNVTNSTANSSNYWDDLDVTNSTQFENNGGTLNIVLTWLNTFIDDWLTGKDTDDLTQGSTNLYDNQSWNESLGDTKYLQSYTDTNVTTACSGDEVLLGNSSCYSSSEFFDDTTIADTDTNVTTACSGDEVLLGNSSCYSSSEFFDDTDTDTNTQRNASTKYLYNDTLTIYFNETEMNLTIDLRDDDTNTQKNSSTKYLYNDSTTIYFNESEMNITINKIATHNSSWNQSFASGLFAPNTSTGIYLLINHTKGWILNFTKIFSDDWSNVSITTSQISDYSDVDTNVTTACSGDEVLLGNSSCYSSSEFFDDTTIADTDTNVTTACSGDEVLLGNSSCYSSSEFFDDTDTDTNTQRNASTKYLYNDTLTIYFNETEMNLTIDKRGSSNSSWNQTVTDSIYVPYTDLNVSSLTNSSVLFFNGSTITEDNANLFWDNHNNRLGIGTNSPSSPLHIAGAGNFRLATDSSTGSPYFTFAQGATTRAIIQYLDAGDLLTFQNPNGNVRLVIENSGEVGIGTSAPIHKLETVGNISAHYFYGNGSLIQGINKKNSSTKYLYNDTLTIYFNETELNSTIDIRSASCNTSGTCSGGDVAYMNYNNGAKNFTVDTTIFHVDSTNNKVGVGTTTPAQKFQVTDTNSFQVAPNLAATGEIPAGVALASTDDLTLGALAGTVGLKTVIPYYNGGAFYSAVEIANVGSGFGDLLLMKSGGKVGIGTGSETLGNYPLSISRNNSETRQFYGGAFSMEWSNVNGSDNTWSQMVFTDEVGGAGSAGFGCQLIDTSNDYGDLHFSTRGADGFTTRLFVGSDGNVGIGTTSPTEVLDVSTGNLVAERLYADLSGTTAAPAISFHGDDNTGIRSNVDKLLLITGGADRLIVDDDGEVGIGFLLPNITLEVNGNISGKRISGHNDGVNQNAFEIYSADNELLSAVFESPAQDGEFYVYENGESVTVKLNSDGDSYLTGGDLGIGETEPITLLEMVDTEPYLTLHNLNHEDTDGGRESKIIARGEQSGGEESVLATIEFAHQGTGDDEKGEIYFYTNDGNDATTPTKRAEYTSTGVMNYLDSLGNIIYQVDMDNVVLSVQDSVGTTQFYVSPTKSFFSTEVGIGTTAPTQELNVVGDLNVTNIIMSGSLSGTYTNGEAYLCVYNNGTIFAKDSACS